MTNLEVSNVPIESVQGGGRTSVPGMGLPQYSRSRKEVMGFCGLERLCLVKVVSYVMKAWYKSERLDSRWDGVDTPARLVMARVEATRSAFVAQWVS